MTTPSDFGGYEYRFVNDPPDALLCKICHHPCKEPYLSGCCGHNFCKTCLEAARRNATNCPYCRNQKDFATLCNKLSDREIRSLHVMCTNKERGCEWQGELNDISNHLGNTDSCQFEDAKCSGCGKVLQRRHLTSHVATECPHRKVDCQYCHITGEHRFIKGEHKEQCPKLPLPCPNKCEVGSVPREDMQAHKIECPLEEIKCSIECGKVLIRQDLARHVEIECPRRKVVCKFCQITDEHQVIYGQHYKEECPMLPLPCPNKCEVVTVPREDMEAHRKECPLEIVQCEYHNVGCEERMMRKDLEKHKKDKMEKHLFLTASELTNIKSQLATSNKQMNAMIVALHEIAVTQGHTKSAALILSVAGWSVKLTAMAAISKPGKQVCPVIVSITEYSKQKNDNIGWYSDSFYTHDKGYKMCLNICAAGEGVGESTHLSLFLFLMKGPHDDKLTWPLREKFEIKLFNQINDSDHHSLMLTYSKAVGSASRVYSGRAVHGRGYLKFISNKDLHIVTPTCQYLKDDCIFLQVSKL
ncbi:TNF receptor-associated factor 4-like [Dysidea avara]|uniref:TNF receptor-associated factor 4-like n=1 Tax=Dysidea avara TaxID=196820 RepID=UPI00333263FA